MNCSFCKHAIPGGRGKIVASKTGETTQFCSRTCERFLHMGKKAAKLKWTLKLVEKKKGVPTGKAG